MKYLIVWSYSNYSHKSIWESKMTTRWKCPPLSDIIIVWWRVARRECIILKSLGKNVVVGTSVLSNEWKYLTFSSAFPSKSSQSQLCHTQLWAEAYKLVTQSVNMIKRDTCESVGKFSHRKVRGQGRLQQLVGIECFSLSRGINWVFFSAGTSSDT